MIVDEHTRVIGKIISIDTYSCTIELLNNISNFCINGFDDIHYFAQINSYIIIPQQNNYIVGEVVGIEELEVHNKQQKGSKEQVEVIHYLKVVLVGTLRHLKEGEHKFEIGVSNYPPLYSNVLYVRDKELDVIFKVENAEEPVEKDKLSPSRLRALTIGQSAVFHEYDIKVDINNFFGSHSAILGNTGSGKSCTISSIIQSLYKKQDYAALGSTFLFFDINGEYLEAFHKLSKTNPKLKVKYLYFDEKPDEDKYKKISMQKFSLPHWFLNIEEWRLLLQASDRTQLPILRNAIRFAAIFSNDTDKKEYSRIKNSILAKCIITILNSEQTSVAKLGRIQAILQNYSTEELNAEFLKTLNVVADFGNMKNQDKLNDEVRKYILEDKSIPNISLNQEFKFSKLGEALDLSILYEEAHGNNQIRNYCSNLLTRFDSLESRSEFDFLKDDTKKDDTKKDDTKSAIDRFFYNLLGIKAQEKEVLSKESQIIIIDMNSLEDELIEVVSSVVTRIIFESLQKAEPRNEFPVNLVLEEAHRYIPHENKHFPANLVFERVAKEGRKYGVFLLVSSQRPSELSKTVLSQCSNFIVHRIQNPEDLSYIKRMTPHISDMVLNRLPYLPEQHALIFGHSINIPSTFKVLNANPCPKSNNNKISENWFISEDIKIGVKFFPDY